MVLLARSARRFYRALNCARRRVDERLARRAHTSSRRERTASRVYRPSASFVARAIERHGASDGRVRVPAVIRIPARGSRPFDASRSCAHTEFSPSPTPRARLTTAPRTSAQTRPRRRHAHANHQTAPPAHPSDVRPARVRSIPSPPRRPASRTGTRPIAPSVAIARAVGRPPRLPAPPLAPVPRAPPDPSRATFQTRPEPRLHRVVPTAHLPRVRPSARPPPRRRRRERLAEHSEHLERQHADAFGPASSDDIVDPDAEPFEDANDTPIEPIEPSPRVRSKGPRRGSKTPASAAAPATPEGQRLVDLVRAEAGRDASPSQRRVDALLRAEDESRPVAPVRGPNATAATRTAANANRRDDGGTAGFKKPTAAGASSATDAAAESSSRGGFLNFGSFWRRTPEDRSPELTKKPSRTLTSAEKSRLFSRLHADPSKSVADPDPEETFRPKISTQSRRIGRARARAREPRHATRGLPPAQRHGGHPG